MSRAVPTASARGKDPRSRRYHRQPAWDRRSSRRGRTPPAARPARRRRPSTTPGPAAPSRLESGSRWPSSAASASAAAFASSTCDVLCEGRTVRTHRICPQPSPTSRTTSWPFARAATVRPWRSPRGPPIARLVADYWERQPQVMRWRWGGICVDLSGPVPLFAPPGEGVRATTIRTKRVGQPQGERPDRAAGRGGPRSTR